MYKDSDKSDLVEDNAMMMLIIIFTVIVNILTRTQRARENCISVEVSPHLCERRPENLVELL